MPPFRIFLSKIVVKNAGKSLRWPSNVRIFRVLIKINIIYEFMKFQACFGRVWPQEPAKSSIFEIAHRTAQTVQEF